LSGISMRRFLISAAHKSSGKTTVAVGLAAAMRARGLAVHSDRTYLSCTDPGRMNLLKHLTT